MKKIQSENYLERIPVKADIKWKLQENSRVTLEIENKGMFNRMAQKFFKKPKISYVHLDEMGSFIWTLIDGEKDIITIGEHVKETFGEKANPLYERLSKYIRILNIYGFITFKRSA